MCKIKKIFIIIFAYNIERIICHDRLNYKYSGNNISSYRGESFPTKYLTPEESFPTSSDLEYYIKSLHRSVTYLYKELLSYNDTEVNRALGMFFMKAVVKRTVRENREKLSEKHYSILKDVIKKGDYLVSHYVDVVKQMRSGYDNGEVEYRVARVMRDDSAQVHSIGDFNKGRLQKWILSNIPMHSYTEQMDNATLPRETYANITEHMDSFFINVEDSDKCLSHVVYNPEPVDLSRLRPCVSDAFCRKAMLSSPSAAYALSHRLLNVLMLRHSRRCYIQTEKEDDDLMDSLCSFMYREAVYVARLGFFARDLFLEHVALCSLFGYEEFFRLRWFRKVASWTDNKGCIYESHNFLINRTRIQAENEKNVNQQHWLRKKLKWTLLEECHSHPMALLVIVLAHAIRYVLHLINK